MSEASARRKPNDKPGLLDTELAQNEFVTALRAGE